MTKRDTSDEVIGIVLALIVLAALIFRVGLIIDSDDIDECVRDAGHDGIQLTTLDRWWTQSVCYARGL